MFVSYFMFIMNRGKNARGGADNVHAKIVGVGKVSYVRF